MIAAQIIADSKNEFGNRLTTMVVTFPRYILAEFNTHRMLSKNSASSRAIPFEKMLKSVKENPFIPMAWQKNHPGMQGTEYCTEREHEVLNNSWILTSQKVIEQVEYMAKYANPTKQMINRPLEAYMYHTCIVSGTEWENFFALRCPNYVRIHGKGETSYRSRKDYSESIQDQFEEGAIHTMKDVDWLRLNRGMADIHMMALAEAMWNAYNESIPKNLKAGEWHIPYFEKILEKFLSEESLATKNPIVGSNYVPIPVKISTMMCARVSYTTIGEEGGEWSLEKYITKHDSLITQKPLHASPLEHCAQSMSFGEYDNAFHKGDSGDGPDFYSNGWSGNFRGFRQYRKMIPNENVTK